MGDAKKDDLRVGFDRRLKLKFIGSQVTTDAGLLAYRELDEALGLTDSSAASLQDARLGQNKQHGLCQSGVVPSSGASRPARPRPSGSSQTIQVWTDPTACFDALRVSPMRLFPPWPRGLLRGEAAPRVDHGVHVHHAARAFGARARDRLDAPQRPGRPAPRHHPPG